MTYRTWRKWLRRYADAYMARVMAGGAPTCTEQEISRLEAERGMVEAERRLLGATHLTTGRPDVQA
jgi:hypothetical protein